MHQAMDVRTAPATLTTPIPPLAIETDGVLSSGLDPAKFMSPGSREEGDVVQEFTVDEEGGRIDKLPRQL